MNEQPIIINAKIIVPYTSPKLEAFLVAMAKGTSHKEHLMKFGYESEPRLIRKVSPYIKAGFCGDTARGVDGGLTLAFSDSFITTHPYLFDPMYTRDQTIQLEKPSATARKDDLLYLLYEIKSPSGLRRGAKVVRIEMPYYVQLFNGTPLDPDKEPLKYTKETAITPDIEPTLAQRTHRAHRPLVATHFIAGTRPYI